MSSADLPLYLDWKTLRERVGVTRVTIDRMRRDLPEYKDEGKVYLGRDDVLRWMQDRRRAA